MSTDTRLAEFRVALAERVPAAALTAVGVAIVVLAPLPSIRLLVGADFPVSLNPVTVLVATGLILVWARGERFPFLARPGLLLVAVVNLELLFIAWYRTYGYEAGPSDMALYGHSVVVFLAGPIAVMCAAHDRASLWIAVGMTMLLALVGVSVVAEWIGVYHPPVEDVVGPLSVKPNGGIMLQANEAGALIGTFAVPAAILLRNAGDRALAAGVVVASLPVLAITRSREGMIVFAVTLLAAAVLERRPRLLVALAAACVVGLAVLAVALPDHASRLVHDPNSFLSGRPTLWRAALEFVDAGNLWLNGGGLGGFDTYVRGDLGYAFTTHNEYLRLLVDGGVLMLAAWVALLAVLWFVARSTGGAEGMALQVAVAGSAVLGLTKDNGPFTHGSAWIWVLAALVVWRQAHKPQWPSGATDG